MPSGVSTPTINNHSIRQYAGLAVFLGILITWWAAFPPQSAPFTYLYRSCVLLPGLLACRNFWLSSRQASSQTKFITGLAAIGLAFWIIEDILYILPPHWQSSTLALALIRWVNLAGWILLASSSLAYLLIQQRVTLKLKLLLDLVISTGSFVVLCYVLFINPDTTFSSSIARIPVDLTWFPIQDLILIALLVNILMLTYSPIQGRILVFTLIGFFFFYVSDYYRTLQVDKSQFNPQTTFNLSLLFGYAAIWLASRFAPSLDEEVHHQQFSQRLVTGWAIRERVQSTLPIALPIVMIVELLVFWQRNVPISQSVLVVSAVLWLLLIARMGVAAGEFELQQYAILFQSSAEAAFLCDPNRKFLQVNSAMIKICGFTNQYDLLETKLDRFILQLDESVKSSSYWSAETKLLTRSGNEIPIDLSLQSIELGFFRRKLVTGAIHDLTAQKEQQEMLQQAYDRVNAIQLELQLLNEDLEIRVAEKTRSLSTAYAQLEEQHTQLQSLDQMKSDFVSLVSHELRAPLTNISGGIELVLTGKKPVPESTRQSLLLVQSEIKRLTRFVETILDLSVLDAGKMPLYPELIRMEEFARVIQKHYHSIPGADRLEWQIHPDLPDIYADSQALASVFMHIIDNALKYAPEGNITITCIFQHPGVICTVTDSGPGIPDELLENIFAKFFRVENADARVIYGHGLGLYMARKLLQEMGGDILVANAETGGAVFTISLPIGKENK